jgi:dihydroflavonol-4-reductase
MATVLVTGATGFLGRHTVRALRARGHAVRAMARNPPRDAQAQLGEGVTISRGDVLDPATLTAAMAGVEAVVHLAGMVSRRPEDAEELYRAHVLGTRAVLTAARATGARKVVYASTSGTVGISDEPRVATERDDAPVRWLSRFGYYRAKWLAEKEALAASGPGFEVASVNPSLLLGPGDAYGSSTDDVRKFLDRSIPAAPRGGIAFVDARDAAESVALALDRGRGGERYLINAANMTVRDFFGRLERISGVRGPTLGLPKSRMAALAGNAVFSRAVKAIGGEPPVDAASVEMGQLFWYVSSEKAERELGWSARDPNETLADTVRDLRGA